MVFWVVDVEKRELVRIDDEVFLEGGDVLGRVNVVAGMDGIGALVVCAGSSTQFVIGPLHCPADVQVMKDGPSCLSPRLH